jgi:hypothetical protein
MNVEAISVYICKDCLDEDGLDPVLTDQKANGYCECWVCDEICIDLPIYKIFSVP